MSEEKRTMLCPQCGQETFSWRSRCQNCGAVLHEDEKVSRSRGTSDFRKALLWTAIPIVLISLISIVVPFIWFGGALVFVIAFFIAIVRLLQGERGIAGGIFAGIGIGVVALGLTCFASMNLFY